MKQNNQGTSLGQNKVPVIRAVGAKQLGPNMLISKIKQNLEDSRLEPKPPKAKASVKESDDEDYDEGSFEEETKETGEDPLEKLRKALNREN